VTARLARLVLRLYPQRWRERYGPEYEALLDDHGVDARTLADMIHGALDARFGAALAGSQERRSRVALAASLWAFVAFAAACAGFQKMGEYDDFTAAASHHAAIAAGRDLVYAGAGVIACACCAGALVLAPALWRGLRRPRGSAIVAPLAVAAGATIAFAVGIAAIAVFAHLAAPHTVRGPANVAVVGAWAAWSALCAAVALAAAGRVLARLEIGAAGLHRAVALAWLGAVGLAVGLAGLVLWGVALRMQAPAVFDLSDGGVLSTPTAPTWAAQLVAGGAALGLALAALSRTRAGGASPRPRTGASSRWSPPPAGRSSSSG
jgi:hypothetical protein